MPKAIQHRQGETAGWFRCCFGSPARTWGKALEMAGRGQHDHGYLYQCRVLLRTIVFLCDSRYDAIMGIVCLWGAETFAIYYILLILSKIYRFAVKTSILSAAFLNKNGCFNSGLWAIRLPILVLLVSQGRGHSKSLSACSSSACIHHLPTKHQNNDLHSITT